MRPNEPADDSPGSIHEPIQAVYRGQLLKLGLAIALAVVLGIGLGWLASLLNQGNRIAVGNTGKMISAVIRDGDALVVVGGGTTRTDLADLVDRSTVPWRRHVSLLVIGTNGDQALGALDLIERGGVGTVAVVGLPESEPIWDVIDREAAQHGTAIKYLDQPTRVSLTNQLNLELVPVRAKSEEGSTGALVRTRADKLRINWVDGISKSSGWTAGDSLLDLRSSILIDADGGKLPADLEMPALAIQPAPARSSALTAVPSRLSATLDSGEQIQLRFSENELRLPRNSVVDTERVEGGGN